MFNQGEKLDYVLDSYLGDELNQSDWFHKDERFNQGNENEVHQEDEFNDCDQCHHVEDVSQYGRFNIFVH